MGVETDGPVVLLVVVVVVVVIESAKAILEPTHPRGNIKSLFGKHTTKFVLILFSATCNQLV